MQQFRIAQTVLNVISGSAEISAPVITGDKFPYSPLASGAYKEWPRRMDSDRRAGSILLQNRNRTFNLLEINLRFVRRIL